MVQILSQAAPRKSFGSRVSQGLGQGLAIVEQRRQEKLAQEAAASKSAAEQEKALAVERLKGQNQIAREQEKYAQRAKLLKGLGLQPEINLAEAEYEAEPQPGEHPQFDVNRATEEAVNYGIGENQPERPVKTAQRQPQLQAQRQTKAPFTQDQILAASIVDPNAQRAMQSANDEFYRQERHQRDVFESERGYHTQFSKESEKEVEGMRNALPRLETALDLARDAVETGDVSFFSPDRLADYTKLDVFRTAKGAQLITAAKENLLGNLSRVSARAQNMWMEQRMSSMFPKIGQSKEANLTVQEMLEAESAMNKAFVNEFDRLAEQDLEEHGFVRKDINKRAHNAVNIKNKDIMRRASFRMKEIQESEEGLQKLKGQVGKNVIKGTPLTLAMAKLYKDKFGKEAVKVAEKNGYYIPSIEEYATFRERPQEFREEL